MSTRTISPELKSAMKQLRLGKLLDTLPDRLVLAEKDDMPRDEFLLMLFTDEINRRQSTATSRRADEAGLDPDMVLERWDKTAKVTLDRRLLQELCALRFLSIEKDGPPPSSPAVKRLPAKRKRRAIG